MFDFIGIAIGFLFAILIVSGIIFLVGYAFKNSGVKVDFDVSLNGYFYFVRLISGGVFCLAGLSRILQAIFAMIFGEAFSFQMTTYNSRFDENELIEMLDGSIAASLFTGITTAIISGIIFAVHIYLQSKNDKKIVKDKSSDIVFKILVFSGTIFFGLVTIVSLVGSIEELYKFILFDSIQNVENYDKGVPGEPLSIALSALIGWSVTLRRLIRVISKK